MAAGGVIIAQIAQIWHTACRQILVEALSDVSIRTDRMVQLNKFRKGKWIDHKLHIASSQISSQFTGEQPGIGTGDVNIAVQFHPERIDTFLPGLHLLDLIKKEVDLTPDF